MSTINPSHYLLASGREAFEVIGDVCDTLESRGVGGAEIYYVGSALKYLCRLGAKGDPTEQVRKAIRFLQMAVDANDTTGTPRSPAEIAVQTMRADPALFRDLCISRTAERDNPIDALVQEAEALGLRYDTEGFGGSDFGDFDE